jgi:hypothetical protein
VTNNPPGPSRNNDLTVSSDALVFFGATGDLAYKKIFPSLQSMIRRGTLNVPVIAVAKAGWTLEALRPPHSLRLPKDSGEKQTGLNSLTSVDAQREPPQPWTSSWIDIALNRVLLLTSGLLLLCADPSTLGASPISRSFSRQCLPSLAGAHLGD